MGLDRGMNSKSRLSDGQEDELPCELIELAKQIAQVPGPNHEDLDAAFCRVVDAVKRRRRILAIVQEALSQLRLDIKYLMFDLDVTRKERDELLERLE